MTRKPLPKAIRQPIGQVRGYGASPVIDEEAPAPRSAAPGDATDGEPVLAITSRPVANDPLPAASLRDATLSAKRQQLARKIVERHKLYAAMGGLSPLPVVNIAGVTAVIMRMVKQLSALYGVPFERDGTRATVISLMGGAVPTGFGVATASTLAFILPASALVGLAVSAVTAGALTRGIGMVFVEHFETAAA